MSDPHWAGSIIEGPEPIPVCCCKAHAGIAKCPKCPRHGEGQEPTLIEAARAVLAAWDDEDHHEKNDLSDELWTAFGALRDAVYYFKEER